MNAAATSSRRPEAVRALEEFAAVQHGYVTRAQAAQVGIGDVLLLRLVMDSYLERWEHGIYRFRGSHDLLWAGVWVAWLRLDPERDAVERASHPTEIARGPTAASVYVIGDLQPEPYEFWTASRRRIRRPDVRLRTGRPPDEDIAVVKGLPLTTPERTVADMVADGYDLGHVRDVIRDGIHERLLDRSGLPERLGTCSPARCPSDGERWRPGWQKSSWRRRRDSPARQALRVAGRAPRGGRPLEQPAEHRGG